METKEIKINVPEGYEIDQENSTFECIKFKPVKKELPKTWEEFCKTHPRKAGEGYVTSNSTCSTIATTDGFPRNPEDDRNLLPSKELAEAMLALCQLIQLRDCYNDDWTPNWTNGDEPKYVLFPCNNEMIRDRVWPSNRILSFKTQRLRDQFFKNFQDLIETAKPLL